MNPDQIPNREEYQQLREQLKAASVIALKLSGDPVHRQSGHMAACLGRIRAATENLQFHDQCLALQAAPAQKLEVSSEKVEAPIQAPNS